MIGIDWIMAGLGLTGRYMIGNKNRWGWMVGLLNQCFWIYFIFDKGYWGFMVITVVQVYLGIKFFILWGRDENEIGL